MIGFAPLPDPPYYAVIFTNRLRDNPVGYPEMSEHLAQMATRQPGYIGIETVRDADGYGITVSYWADEDAVRNWKAVAEHAGAQKLGKTRWYAHYHLRIAKVERQYDGPDGRL